MITKTVTILRGVPGSGKSTWAKKFHPSATVCSADHFFECKKCGAYHFDASKISEAHSECRAAFRRALASRDVVDIIIDNTNTQRWEFAYYVHTAQDAGCDVEVIQFNIKYEDMESIAARNVHGVPADAVKRMYKNMEGAIPLVSHETIIPVH